MLAYGPPETPASCFAQPCPALPLSRALRRPEPPVISSSFGFNRRTQDKLSTSSLRCPTVPHFTTRPFHFLFVNLSDKKLGSTPGQWCQAGAQQGNNNRIRKKHPREEQILPPTTGPHLISGTRSVLCSPLRTKLTTAYLSLL